MGLMRTAERLRATTPGLQDMLVDIDNRLHARWWHKIFPWPERRRRQRRAEEQARLEKWLDDVYAQIAEDESQC